MWTAKLVMSKRTQIFVTNCPLNLDDAKKLNFGTSLMSRPLPPRRGLVHTVYAFA